MKKSCCHAVSTVLFFFMFYPLCVSASPGIVEVVETEGTYPVYNNDRAPARDSAIGDSMRRAVEGMVGRLISEEVASENADALDGNIYSRYQDYVRDYRIMQESMENGLYRVRVRVTLLVMNIRRVLEKLGVLTGEWRQEETTTAVITVVVRGIEKYGDFRTLKESLETDTRGVDAVRLRRMGLGVAVMDVVIQGDASVLANELQLKKFRKFSLSVTEITRDTVELNMAKE